VAGCQMPYVSIRRRGTESWVPSAHSRLLRHHSGGCRARHSYPTDSTCYRGGSSGSAAWRLFVGSLHRVLCGLGCVTHHDGTCESGVCLSTGQVNVKCWGHQTVERLGVKATDWRTAAVGCRRQF